MGGCVGKSSSRVVDHDPSVRTSASAAEQSPAAIDNVHSNTQNSPQVPHTVNDTTQRQESHEEEDVMIRSMSPRLPAPFESAANDNPNTRSDTSLAARLRTTSVLPGSPLHQTERGRFVHRVGPRAAVIRSPTRAPLDWGMQPMDDMFPDIDEPSGPPLDWRTRRSIALQRSRERTAAAVAATAPRPDPIAQVSMELNDVLRLLLFQDMINHIQLGQHSYAESAASAEATFTAAAATAQPQTTPSPAPTRAPAVTPEPGSAPVGDDWPPDEREGTLASGSTPIITEFLTSSSSDDATEPFWPGSAQAESTPDIPRPQRPARHSEPGDPDWWRTQLRVQMASVFGRRRDTPELPPRPGRSPLGMTRGRDGRRPNPFHERVGRFEEMRPLARAANGGEQRGQVAWAVPIRGEAGDGLLRLLPLLILAGRTDLENDATEHATLERILQATLHQSTSNPAPLEAIDALPVTEYATDTSGDIGE